MTKDHQQQMPDPTGDFDAETPLHQPEVGLWPAFSAAHGDGETAQRSDEQLPPGDGSVDIRPLRQRFQQRSRQSRSPDPTTDFDDTATASRPDGVGQWSNEQLPPGDGTLWTDANGPRMYVRPEAFDSCLLIGDTVSEVVRAAKVPSGRIDLNPPAAGLAGLQPAVSGRIEEPELGPAELSGKR